MALQDNHRIKQEHQPLIFSFNSPHTETHDGIEEKRYLEGFVLNAASLALLFLIPLTVHTPTNHDSRCFQASTTDRQNLLSDAQPMGTMGTLEPDLEAGGQPSVLKQSRYDREFDTMKRRLTF